jgi:HEAT repeat protein
MITLPTSAATIASAATLQVTPLLPEPDRAGDALANPQSERLPQRNSYRISVEAQKGLAGPDSALIAQFITALDHTPRHKADLIRERSAWALDQVSEGRLIEPLIDALGSNDWREQAYAAWALATARDPRAIPRLIPLLEHPVWRLRAMAAYALAESHDPRVALPMQAALIDPAWQVRVQAVEYFAMTAHGDALSGMIRPLLNDRHIAVRLAARAALTTH